MCNSKESMHKLIDDLDEFLFDSIVFIFGISKGEYLEELEKREEQYRILKKGERILKENEQYLLEKNLNALLHQLEPLEGEALSLKQSIEVYFPLQNRKLMTILINIDGDSYEKDSYHYQDNQLIRFAIRNIFNESNIKSDKIIINNF